MRKVLITSLFFLLSYSLTAQDLPDGKSLLEASDKAYIPQHARFTMKIENYENGSQKQWYQMDCHVDGADRYLLVFTDPGIMRGQTQLRLGGTIYYYVRRIDRIKQVSARLSFQQSILSQEDVMSATLSSFYDMEKLEETTGDEGRELYSMTLTAKDRHVAYARIIANIDKKSLLPVNRLYYARSGQLVKKMITEEIRKAGDKLEYVRFRIVDALRPQNYAVVTMYDFDTSTNMPGSMFTRQYMRAAAR